MLLRHSARIYQASNESQTVGYGQEIREIPVSGIRKAIATNMVKSKHEAPHAWMMVEVDVTNLVNYRNQVKKTLRKKKALI